jgi:hypothetical protein
VAKKAAAIGLPFGRARRTGCAGGHGVAGHHATIGVSSAIDITAPLKVIHQAQ